LKRPEIISLLRIAILAWTILGPALVISSGTCDYCWGDGYPSTNAEQQRIWMNEAFNFLYCDYCYQGFWPYYSQEPASIQTNDNDTSDHWLGEGNRFYLAGSYENAAASYAEAIKLDPYLSEALLNRGNALYFMGQYQESLASYDALLGQEPQNVNALKGKSQALLALNRTGESDHAKETIRALQSRNILRVGSSDNKPIVKPAVIGEYTS
jgi:tetratricopeptide (TPR) repeat protein